ncbi:DUF4190 domain-containing protein [Streptomyces sp. N2-109]|uniref:DUF4190 domain-containing protein n=1 Tax=Streptomyces gossypii TaxID=2883101 RepID=A0ABT2K1Z4_9ACTN|nr:DUF4190 domain-containing protein [Streptomyces gossypii]MCT2594197.1 DUF4190 domain-containing protein [Streptomyces gossypii]
MAEDAGQSGHSGREKEDPWAPPEEDNRLRKRNSVAEQPTMTAMPGGPVVGGPPSGARTPWARTPTPGVGPPPPAPSTSHPHAQQSTPYAGPYGATQPGGPYGYSSAGPQHPGYQGYPGYAGYPAQPGHLGYGHPGMGWGPPLPNGQSVAAMVLGIVSMVLIASCYGIVLALVTSPIALGLGIAARRKVARGELGGHSQATAGFVMGIIGVVISVLAVVVVVIALTVYTDADSDDGDSGHADTVDARAVPAVPTDRPLEAMAMPVAP